MEESIKIQEEFENLIQQLEKLKKINEITTLNTEAATIVIKETKTFAKNANNYFSNLENNLNTKTKELDKLISTTQSTIKQLNAENNNNFTKFVELIDDLNLKDNFESIQQFNVANNEFLEVINSQVDEIKDELKKVIFEQGLSVKELKQLITNSNSELSNLLNKQIEMLEKKLILLIEQNILARKEQKTDRVLLYVVIGILGLGAICAFVLFGIMIYLKKLP